MMQIEVGKTYRGSSGKKRRVLSHGASIDYVVWGDPKYSLPLGGFHGPIRCTKTKSFEKWAVAETD